MAQYKELISSKFNFSESITQMKSHLNCCVCCLVKDEPFINLNSCNHASYFNTIFGYKPEYRLICYPCHNIIKRIDSFKRQVEESLLVLSGLTTDLEANKRRKVFGYSDIEINSAVDHLPIEHEVIRRIRSTDDRPQNHEIKTEVKIEHDDFSDFENDFPLAKLKKNKEDKRKKKQKIKKRTPIHAKYEGKIRMIIISREEMMEERERDALKKAYMKLPFKCENCITGFDHEMTLKVHMEQRHGKGKGGLVCDVCKSVLSTETSYKEHMKRHVRRYECEACGKRHNNVYSVVKHYNEQHGTITTQFTCNECGFTTGSHRSYRYHRDKHKAKVECSECGNTFVNRTGLRVHMFTVHGHSDRVYSCDVCSKRYRAKSGLAAHAATHTAAHALDAYCAPCKTHFRSTTGLKHHLKTHSKHVKDTDKRFICDECGSKFLTKSSLQEHIDWIHLKKAKYECNKCNKVFKNSSALTKHKRFVHEKIRPPRNKICDHCGRGFTTSTILQSHIRTHTGERPLRCTRCPATFAHSAALYTHNKLLHSNTAD